MSYYAGTIAGAQAGMDFAEACLRDLTETMCFPLDNRVCLEVLQEYERYSRLRDELIRAERKE
jgi:hypothetical protein